MSRSTAGGRRATAGALALSLLSGLTAAVVLTTPVPAQAKVTPAETRTTTLSADFSTRNQSLWGAGDASAPGTQRMELFDEDWNESAGGEDFTDLGPLGEFGGGGSVSTEGRIGMSLDLEGMDDGKVGVDYPVEVDVTTPAPKSFGAGDTIEISTSVARVRPGAKITTVEPSMDAVALNGTVRVKADASFRICLFGCFGADETLIDIPFTTGRIVRVDAAQIRGQSGGSPVDTYCFGSSETSVLGLTGAADPTRCPENGGYLARPNPQVSTTTNADGSLSGVGSDTFAVIPISAMVWAQRLAGESLPLNKSVGLGDGADLTYKTFDVGLNTRAKRTEKLEFASKVDVTLALPRTMSYRVLTPAGVEVGRGQGTSVTMATGNKVLVDVPTDQTTAFSVLPTLSLSGQTLTNEVVHSIEFDGEMSALSARLQLPGLSMPDPIPNIPGFGFDIGPAWKDTFSAPTSTVDAVPRRTWPLGGFNAPTLAPVQLVPAPPPVVTPVTVRPVEGAPSDLTVATFTDEVTKALPSDYTATITWGDKTAAVPATITGSNGSYAISARHTYEQYGTYPVGIDLRTVPEGQLATNRVVTTAEAVVSDAALTGTGLTNNTTASGQKVLTWSNPSPGAPNDAVATFADANPFGLLSDLSATIDWGDGTATSAGTVSGGVGGPFTVSGEHDYAELGLHTVTVTLTSKGGSRATTTTTTLSYTNPERGTFLLGTGRATGPVTFWGAQWAKSNGFSGAASSFKGFASQTPPACGSSWRGSPATGATSLPPSTVPTYMAVAVTDQVTTSGTTATGTTRAVVVVKTDPGYGTAPSQTGTGTVVAVLCGTVR